MSRSSPTGSPGNAHAAVGVCGGMISTVNRRAAEALALESFDALRPAQQRAMLRVHDFGAWPKIHNSTHARTRRSLERDELLEAGSRDLTPWGVLVHTVAKARDDAAKKAASRGNRRAAGVLVDA